MPVGGLWRDRDFLRLWIGQAVSQMGSRISAQALQWAAILVLGASPFQMGLLSGAGGAAILVFGLFAGAWADRVRRRPILIFADLGRAAVLGSIPLAARLHRLTMGHLYLAAAASGILTVFFDASYQAYVPVLVERTNIAQANVKLVLTESIADVGGPALAGVLVQAITAPTAILFDAVSFLCSALSVWRIEKPEPEPAGSKQRRMGREIGEGLGTAWRHPILRALALRTGTAAFFAGFVGSLYYIFAMRELGFGAAVLGGIVSLGGASNLFGALVSERLVRRFGIGPVLIGSALACGGAALLPPLAHGPPAICAAVLMAGQAFDMAWPIYNVNELSLRQTVTPDRLLGRVNSAMHMLFYGIMPAGALAGGAIAEATGVRTTMLAGALGFLLSTLWLVASPIPRLRTLAEAGQE